MLRRTVFGVTGLLLGLLLLVAAGALPAMAAPGSPTALPVMDDFEGGIPSTLGVFNDSGSSVQLALDTQPLPTVPAVANNATAIVTYTIAGGGYGGITEPFTAAQDWTGYHAFGFWLYGSNSGLNHRIELKSQEQTLALPTCGSMPSPITSPAGSSSSCPSATL